jgi:RNA polymerase sigma-70 factor (ECF subfamily)
MAWDIAIDRPIGPWRIARPASSTPVFTRAGSRSHGVGDIEQQLKALMLRGLAGHAGAEAEMLRALAGHLRGFFARRLGRDAAESEDLVQETLIAVHLKRHTFDITQPFTPWAYAIARYKFIDHLRRSGSRREAPLEDADALLASDDREEREAQSDLARLLTALPERQRTLIVDVKIGGLSIEEASQKSGMSTSAVKVSIHRAVKAMAKRFRDANG